MEEKIDPKQLIKTLGVEELCHTAEQYYKSIPDPTPQMAKPFSFINETPDTLCKLGLLLSGLKLGKTMTVLDFGAGTCWLSKFLNQMGLATISVDASLTALEAGKRLFSDFPIIGNYVSPPRFVHFNGRKIDIDDGSVDRIICFDVFHHIPNQKEVFAEFFRVLKQGGIAGFSEPGSRHSQSPQSQYEMRNYCVLENDIVLEEIWKVAEELGFSKIYTKLVIQSDLELSLREHLDITQGRRPNDRIGNHLFASMENSTVFFLMKGKYLPDSRGHLGLRHSIEISKTDYQTELNEPIPIDLIIKNTGDAKWLHKNIGNIGVVNVGLHLYDANMKLINLDFFRSGFDLDIDPGGKVKKRISPVMPQRGTYYLTVDLVAEGICWFENLGNKPVSLKVTVS